MVVEFKKKCSFKGTLTGALLYLSASVLSGSVLAQTKPVAKPPAKSPVVANQAKPAATPNRQAVKAKMMAALQLIKKEGNSPEAEAALRAVIATDETYAAPYYNLAMLLQQQNKFADAATNYRSFLKYGQQSSFRVEAKLRLAIVERLAQSAPASAQTTPDSKYAAALIAATAFEQQGDLPQAFVQAQRATDLDKKSWKAPLILAQIQTKLGEQKAALISFDRAKTLAPVAEKAKIETLRGGAALAVRQDELATFGLAAHKRNDPSAKDTLFQAWSLEPQREEIGFIAAVKAVSAGDLALALEISQILSGSSDVEMASRAQSLQSDISSIEKLQEEPIRIDTSALKSAQSPSELTEEAFENEGNRQSERVRVSDEEKEKAKAAEERIIAASMTARHLQLAEAWKRAAQTVESFSQPATYQRDRQAYHQSQAQAWRTREEFATLLTTFLSE